MGCHDAEAVAIKDGGEVLTKRKSSIVKVAHQLACWILTKATEFVLILCPIQPVLGCLW